MTTDNRTNEPTEAQIEHVRDQIEAKWPEMVCYWHPHRDDEERQHEWETIETWDIAEAALVAAQGAAPQAGGGAQEELQALRALIEERARVIEQFSGAGEAVEAEQRAIARSIRRDLEDHDVAFAAPVLPSSGVDEDKLAEVIEMHREVYLPKQGDSGCSCGWRRTIGDNDFSAHRARAVAEWLKGRGRVSEM